MKMELVLHHLVEASVYLIRYPELGNELKDWKLHLLVSYFQQNSVILCLSSRIWESPIPYTLSPIAWLSKLQFL